MIPLVRFSNVSKRVLGYWFFTRVEGQFADII